MLLGDEMIYTDTLNYNHGALRCFTGMLNGKDISANSNEIIT